MESSNLGSLSIGSHLMLEEASLILTRQGIKLVFRQAWPMVESRGISTQRGWGTVMSGGEGGQEEMAFGIHWRHGGTKGGCSWCSVVALGMSLRDWFERTESP